MLILTLALPRCIRIAPIAAACAEKIGKDIAENIGIEIKIAEAAAAGCLIKRRHAELVVLRSLFLVAQNGIGFGSFLELGLRILISGIHIGMIFLGKLTVGFFDFLLACGTINAQNLVKISLFCHN